ncbi:MAG: hypothetical protein JOZ07_03035 [Solirubrobacterales bacterium]|nr:hypothetical protein [Solirubrobacterales bacterium]
MAGGEGSRSGDADERDGNVVRLPIDWLGPRDELIPMGSGVRAPDDRDDGPSVEPGVPSAAAFWDETSGELQSAIEPPGDLPMRPPPAPMPRAPRRPRVRGVLRRVEVGRVLKRIEWPTWGWGPAIGAAIAGVLAVLAVIGTAEGGSSHRPNRVASVPSRGVNNRSPRTQSEVRTHAVPKSAGRGPLLPGFKPLDFHLRIPAPTRRRVDTVTRVTHATRSHPVVTTRAAPAVTTPSAPTTPTTASTGTVASSQPTRAVTPTSRPVWGQSGTLGPGSSPDS